MFIHIKEVTYLENYKLRLLFDDGKIKLVDLKDELYGDIFEPLKDKKLFKKVFLNKETQTVEWPNGADFAPEYLYDNGVDIKMTA